MIYKDVVGYEGIYKVSNHGDIISLRRNGTIKSDLKLSPYSDRDGYLKVTLRNKTIFQARVHRLVAQAFIPNPENKPQINHIDGNKKNNHVNNLEWATPSENIRHARRLGLQCGCPNRQRVHQLRDGMIINTFNSLKEAEEKTGVGWTGISATTRGVRKSAGGFGWKRCNDYR